ncbi:MAG: hypothetical protein WA802_03525 [Terracidiphilus sp.]
MNYQLIGHNFTTIQFIAAVTVFVLALVVVCAFVQRRRARSLTLRVRFGTEYDRAVLRFGSAHEIEANPAHPETPGDVPMIRELGVAERERFVSDWRAVQSCFADHPRTALIEADDLIEALLEAHGYPQAGFERRAADVSVDYPRAMEKYRAAHSIAVHLGQVEATNEELRTAMSQYREIFDDLLQTPKRLETGPPRGASLARRSILAPYFGARAR